MTNKIQDLLNLDKFFKKPKDRFINREFSWLEFNNRVLEEAFNEDVPLLERVKFLSICAKNLDEFFMVRVAGLKDQITNEIDIMSVDGLNANTQLDIIYKKSKNLVEQQTKCWNILKELLNKNKIIIEDKYNIASKDKKILHAYFKDNIYPALSPIAVDQSHPFPFIPNLGLSVIFRLENKFNKNIIHSIVLIPSNLDRFIMIGSKHNKNHFLTLEDIIEINQEYLFPDYNILDSSVIHVTRDSELEVSDEAEDLITVFESAVKKRRRGNIISFKMRAKTSKQLKNFLLDEFELIEDDIFEMNSMLDLSAIYQIYDFNRVDLKFKKYIERFPERINDHSGDYFATIKAKDFIVHHPYETFDVVVGFLQQAARDPNVVAIKQTLYRTSYDSPIVKALIEAAEAGIAVTVVVELKARFDEESNIKLSRELERVGAQVVYGFVELKTHAKATLIVRRENNLLKTYLHVGTGNYHPITARSYVDLSFFTCDSNLCKEASYLFNFLTGYSIPESFNNLIISPLNLQEKIVKLINNEINFAKNNKPANIWIKLNSLVDKNIIDRLYYASQMGVKITLVIRGICCIRPGIKGFSDNITVKSIIGRFLEHSRVYCFGNGYDLPNPKALLYIGSADLMPRNIYKRVELLTPIYNETVHEQIMGQILLANIYDKKQSWNMNSDGSYTRSKYTKDSLSAHEYFINNPSLSGRGKAITEDETNKQKQKIVDLLNKDSKKYE